MTHYIEFVRNATCDRLPGQGQRLERIKHKAGEVFACRVRCHVLEDQGRYVEVADIEYGGGLMLNVPCRDFRFIDRNPKENP